MGLVEGPDVHEGGLGQVVAGTFANPVEGADRLLQRRGHSREAREHLGHEEGLAQEALDLAGPGHGELVVLRQLVHAENSDDVLQVAVALKD